MTRIAARIIRSGLKLALFLALVGSAAAVLLVATAYLVLDTVAWLIWHT